MFMVLFIEYLGGQIDPQGTTNSFLLMSCSMFENIILFWWFGEVNEYPE